MDTIRGNGQDGVLIAGASSGNTLSNNAISANGRLGINLQPQGEGGDGKVSLNDLGDWDSGPNGMQNFSRRGEKIVPGPSSNDVLVSLHSVPNETFTVEFARRGRLRLRRRGASHHLPGEDDDELVRLRDPLDLLSQECRRALPHDDGHPALDGGHQRVQQCLQAAVTRCRRGSGKRAASAPAIQARPRSPGALHRGCSRASS